MVTHLPSLPPSPKLTPHSANLLYPKEDKQKNELEFACRTCYYSEKAETTCIFRNELANTVGETAGITQDIGEDPTVSDDADPYYPNTTPDADMTESVPEFCTMCGNEIFCAFCGQANDNPFSFEADEEPEETGVEASQRQMQELRLAGHEQRQEGDSAAS